MIYVPNLKNDTCFQVGCKRVAEELSTVPCLTDAPQGGCNAGRGRFGEQKKHVVELAPEIKSDPDNHMGKNQFLNVASLLVQVQPG